MNPTPAITILAIDDSLTIRKLVDMILRAAGYTVILAEKGEAGLRLAKEHKPDLILLDYVLPDLPSPEICRQLLDDPTTAEIPILLISTNGAAIRQLYTDSKNVKDYLTKPFQAKVLQSVIAHLLSKRTLAAETDNIPVTIAESAEAPPVDLPAERNSPTETANSPQAPATSPRPASTPPLRTAAGRASAASNEAHTFLRTLLNNRFRALARLIPDLESRRGRLAAETYYLPFLLRNELLSEIAAEMGRAELGSGKDEPLIAGTADWMGIDATLLHLGRTAATGVFALRLPRENIDLLLRSGDIVSITSDNPKAYCAGAAFNFRSLQPSVIASAVSAQQHSRVPFFISLHRQGVLRDVNTTLGLLRQQGARAMHRAMSTPGVRYAFIPRENILEPGALSLEAAPRQILLEALRLVDDWLEIESATGSIDTVFRRAAGAENLLGELVLSQDERAVWEMTDGHRPLQEIAAAAALGIYETCSAVYRLLKLHLLLVETSAAPLADSCVEDFLSETATDDWSGDAAPLSPTPETRSSHNPISPWPKF